MAGADDGTCLVWVCAANASLIHPLLTTSHPSLPLQFVSTPCLAAPSPLPFPPRLPASGTFSLCVYRALRSFCLPFGHAHRLFGTRESLASPITIITRTPHHPSPSDIRQVPDSQEVFVDQESDACLILEVLELERSKDGLQVSVCGEDEGRE